MIFFSISKKGNQVCIKLLSGLHCRGLWLIIHLLDVSPHSQEWSFSAGNVDQQRKTTPEDAVHRMRRNVEQMYNQPQTTASSPDSNFMHNAGRESLRQFLNGTCFHNRKCYSLRRIEITQFIQSNAVFIGRNCLHFLLHIHSKQCAPRFKAYKLW